MRKRIRFITAIIAILVLFTSLTDLQAQQAKQPEISNVEEAVEYVRELQFDRDFELGTIEGEKLTKKYPESVQLHAWYLTNMARNDGAEEAVPKAEQLKEEHPDNPWSHFAIAITLNSHSDRAGEALDEAEKALAMMPEHPDFIWLKTEVLYDQKGEQASIDFIDQIAQKISTPVNLITLKAKGLMSLSRDAEGEKSDSLFNEGLVLFEQARETDSTNTDAWYLPGYYYSASRQHVKAYPLLKKSVKLSTAIRVHSDYWRCLMGLDQFSEEKKKAKLLSDINDLEQNRPETAEMVFRLANQFEQLDMKDEGRSYQKRVLNNYPESVWSEWVLVNRYRDFEDEHRKAIFEERNSQLVVEYRQMLWNFINRPKHNRETLIGDAYRNLFYTYREDTTVNSDTLLQVVNGMVKYEGINVHITHGEGPKLLAERGVDFTRAKEIAREGVREARKKINEQKEWAYDTEEEYQKAMDSYTGRMYDALGWVFFHEGQLDSAEKYISKAYSLDSDNRETIYHLGKLHQKRGNNLQAEDYYLKGTGIEGSGDNPNESALKSLYIEMHGSSEGYDEYHAKLVRQNEADRKEEILSSRKENPEPVTPFTLNTLKGDTLSSDQLDGKITIVNIWGIWCGPCVREMPDIQKLHEKYSDNPDVKVLTINNDPSIEKVREWMDENEYSFPVLRDDGYLNEAGIHLFPTTWFLDPEKEIAFIKEGYTEKLVEEFTWRIEDLQGETE